MISIRKALPVEYRLISDFQVNMAMETENVMLDRDIVENGVKAVFSDPAKGCYYVAEINGKVMGSLLTTYEWSDWRNGQIIWIQSVYVFPEHRNKGIFSQLYGYIKQMVEDSQNIRGIRLYVDKNNEKALQIYKHLGINGDQYQLLEWIKTS